MNLLWFLPLAALWGGMWWRLRGGAFTALTGFDPGTSGMRAIAAVGLAGPLMVLSWHYAILAPAFWVAWSIAGWGAFQGMGIASTGPMSNPVGVVLEDLGVRSLLTLDLIGMAAEGMITLAVPAGAMVGLEMWQGVPPIGSFLALAGLLFAPSYYIPRYVFTFPSLGKFATVQTEWGEVLTGASVGLAVAFLAFS